MSENKKLISDKKRPLLSDSFEEEEKKADAKSNKAIFEIKIEDERSPKKKSKVSTTNVPSPMTPRNIPVKKEEAKAPADSSKPKHTFADYVRFVKPTLWPKGHWKVRFMFGISMVLLLSFKIVSVYAPLILKDGIDAIVNNHSDASGFIVGYALCKFGAELIGQLKDLTFANVSASSEVFIAEKVFTHVQNQSLSFHLRRETGKIIRIVSRGSQSFSTILRLSLFSIFPIIIEVVLVVIVLSVEYPYYIVLGTLGSVILYLIVTVVTTEWRAKYFKMMNDKDNTYNQKATDSLLNFETVKYFNAERHEANRYRAALLDYKETNVSVQRSLVVLNVAQQMVICGGLIFNLLMANMQIQKGQLQVGDFVLINAYILQIYTPLNFLGTFWRMIRQSFIDVDQVFDILSVDESIKDMPHAIKPNFKKGKIEFKNVRFSYDKTIEDASKKQMILKGITFTVNPGESVAIVGPTGSGKSTIMRLLYRFYELDSGTITIDGYDIKSIPLYDLRSIIAIVPQDCVLFNDTLQYNILYGGVSENPNILNDIEVARDSSRKAQLLSFIEKQRDGFGTKVGERGLRLSGGEKQRVAIARALLKNAMIMCFDEATSALDTQTEKEIQGAINEASKNRTSVMIAHRLSTIVNCDKIIVIKDGEITEVGSHTELLNKKNGVYKKLWKQQTEEAKKMQEKAVVSSDEDEEDQL